MINYLAKKSITDVANKPGLTKNVRWVKMNNLEILDTADVLMMIAILEETTLSKAKLVEILKRVGGRARKSELNTLWNENHSE